MAWNAVSRPLGPHAPIQAAVRAHYYEPRRSSRLLGQELLLGGTAAAGTALYVAEQLRPPPPTLDRGHEQQLNYVTLEVDPTAAQPDGSPPVVHVAIEGAAFAVAIAALVLARRLRREGVRLLMLVLVIGPVITVVW